MAGGPCRPRSSSKSIAPNREPLVFGTNSGSINEPLIGGSFFVGNGEGIEALAKPIFVRGASPFNGSGTAAPFNGSGTAARPRSSSKSIAPNRVPLVFGTNSGSINEPPIRCSFFCEERGGDRSIGGANLRKGAALQRKRPRRPLQWPARPVPGRRTLRPTRQTGRFCAMQGVNFLNQRSGATLFSGRIFRLGIKFSGILFGRALRAASHPNF